MGSEVFGYGSWGIVLYNAMPVHCHARQTSVTSEVFRINNAIKIAIDIELRRRNSDE